MSKLYKVASFVGVVFLAIFLLILLSQSIVGIAAVRYHIISFLIISTSCLALWLLKKKNYFFASLAGILLMVSVLNLGILQYNRYQFFRNSLDTGKHIILGYRSESEILKLVRRNKVAGVYITSRNVEGKSREEIKTFIDILQRVRAGYSDTPLIIAADQEGGIVSHLSPPLSNTGSIRDNVNRVGSVTGLAQTHGKELSYIGVNLNFAPVVDFAGKDSAAGFSQINERSISDNPQEIIAQTKEYCTVLEEYGVRCTLKHFPNLGGISQDTHSDLGIKKGTLDEVKEDIEVFQTPIVDHAIMVGHVQIEALESDMPASTSKEAVELLRRINPQAQLITDDFSMLPISRDIGVKKAYLDAIEAGIDYVLISYDPELLYQLY